MKKINLKKYLVYTFILLCGILFGWLIFHSPEKNSGPGEKTVEASKETIWTCAMHPQIRMHEPGKCPICGMDLIPLNQGGETMDPAAVYLSEEAAQLANVQTSVVTRQKPVKEVRLYGKVQVDERLLQSQVAHISGRIEKLLVNFTGEIVQKGQTLAIIYSPDIVTAQQELLEAADSKQSQPEIYEAAKEKLYHLRLSESQINSIENSGNVRSTIEVVSDNSGIVTARQVNNGDHVNPGTVLFEVADLSRVWVLFDAYESDLQFLQTGDKIEFTVQAIPGVKFSGHISFIDPVIDPVNRIARVRIETSNQSGRLKPEMFVTGIVKARLEAYKNMLVIPKSAVLWTGTRSIVYVRQAGTSEKMFKIREVGLGPMLGTSYVITDGLTEGEEIVTEGTFSVDAAAQLEGKPSMMNPEGLNTSSAPDKANADDIKTEVSKDFRMQLDIVFEKYIALKESFVQSDANKARQAAGVMQQSLDKTDMHILTGDMHTQWMNISNKLTGFLKQIQSSGDITVQRKEFSYLSSEFYMAVKKFGLTGKKTFYQFCPMAFDGKGAYWLSSTDEIRNPYYGEEMLTCGENMDTLRTMDN